LKRAADKLIPQRKKYQGTTLQAAEILIVALFCNKGTASAGPQDEQNKSRALAPEGKFC
jgi:hypothetical protein